MKEIRQRAARVVDEVLAERQFQQAKLDASGMDRLLERIEDWLTGLRETMRGLPDWVSWAVLAWMVLTLLAIVAHTIYVIYTMTSAADVTRRIGPSQASDTLLGIVDLDYDSVIREAVRAEKGGDWERALRYTYAAAILWLDRVGRVRFKASKTNQDYLAELEGGPGAQLFERLTRAFEAAAYGTTRTTRAICERATRELQDLCDETTRHLAS